MRYANNSQYKNDRMIRKECFVNQSVLDELKKIIEQSEASLSEGTFVKGNLRHKGVKQR